MDYAQYPIWRQANLCLLDIERAVKALPRDHKYTLGSELRYKAMRICQCIYSTLGHKYCKFVLHQQIAVLVVELKYQIQLIKGLLVFRSFTQLQRLEHQIAKYTQAGEVDNVHPQPVAKLGATLASFWWHFKHANCDQLAASLFGRYKWLQLSCSLSLGYFAIVPRYQPQTPLCYKAQVSFFSQDYRDYCLLIQFGKRVYLHHNTQLGSVEGSSVEGGSVKRGAAHLPSWPISHALRVRRQHEKQGIPYVLVNEQGYTRIQTQHRAVRLIWHLTQFIT